MEIKIQTELKGEKRFIKRITGVLKSLVINSESQIDIQIDSELGYTLYKNPEFKGVEYISLKKQSVDEQSHRIQLIQLVLFLNDDVQWPACQHAPANVGISRVGKRPQRRAVKLLIWQRPWNLLALFEMHNRWVGAIPKHPEY